MSSVAILILAAGASTRMDGIKQLLPYNGTTLLGWAIEQAQNTVVSEVLCVLGSKSDQIRSVLASNRVSFIDNPNYAQGLSSSIRQGIKALAKHDAIIIMLADQPHVLSEHLNLLCEQYHKRPKKIIASQYEDTLGVPALFPRKYFDSLCELQGDKGAKSLIKYYKDQTIALRISSLIDIDTPDDYQRLLK